MKLEKLIKELTQHRINYLNKYGSEPHIFSWDEEGLLLCNKIEKKGSLNTAVKPYLNADISVYIDGYGVTKR